MTEPTPEYDDNDDAIPGGLSKDASDVVVLLEWARRRGFAIPHVEIGSVRLRVTDLRQPRREGLVGGSGGDDSDDPYAEYKRDLE
jgi:hypothetical protein